MSRKKHQYERSAARFLRDSQTTPLRRHAEAVGIDPDGLTVELSFSSEAQVDRGDWVEVRRGYLGDYALAG